MKISKYKALRLFSIHQFKKLGESTDESKIQLMTSTITPLFHAYAGTLKFKGILDEDERIDLSNLRRIMEEFFRIVPSFNVPIGNSFFNITKEDSFNFLIDLEKNADIDEVIYLPCQN